MAGVLIAYGVVLAALGLVVKNIAPGSGRVTFIAGLAGGGLCLLWGGAALAGLKGRAWATLSVVAAVVVLLIQTVRYWTASSSEGAGSVMVSLLVTVMLLLTVGMVLYLLHGERPPEFYEGGVTRRENPGSNQNQGPSRNGRSRR